VLKQRLEERRVGRMSDLPKSRLGIDTEHDFVPKYVVPVKAKKVLADLKAMAKKSKEIILATDEDREGEAIAWHLAEALGLKQGYARIVFHEITETAIREAIAHPRALDMHLVDAQQARRILDRLVGYELSPFLWRKVRAGLSAGRVQSVAVRLVVEREREITAFVPITYFSVDGVFEKTKDGDRSFSAGLTTIDGTPLEKMGLRDEREAAGYAADAKGASYTVSSVEQKEMERHPAAPFTTSTLQQEAARKLGFSAKQTMTIAQQLYEQGLITYMRTDSVFLAHAAVADAREVVSARFGKEYLPASARAYKTKSKGAQEAHEAIRPTSFRRDPDSVSGDRGQSRLYALIWKRAIASQMASARFLAQSAELDGATALHRYRFKARGQTPLFDGFLAVYLEGKDDESDEDEGTLPALREGDALRAETVVATAHVTEPPARYSDATLIKALEAHGIGRPSTYAPTLSTIQDRKYVEKIEKKYHPTEIGTIVTDLLVEHFPEIVDIGFTSRIEAELDEIADGEKDWVSVCRTFYTPFKEHLIEKEASVMKQIEVSDTPCPHCGQMMIVKFGRSGKFLACPEPGVKVTLPLPEEAAEIKRLAAQTAGERCPLCGALMDVKRGRFGYFLGCSRYPECKGISKIWNKTGFTCPACMEDPIRKEKPGAIVQKKSRGRGKPFYACTRYPDCTIVIPTLPANEDELMTQYRAWKEKPPKAPRVFKKMRR
jgi:DNA topoisomerase-1